MFEYERSQRWERAKARSSLLQSLPQNIASTLAAALLLFAIKWVAGWDWSNVVDELLTAVLALVIGLVAIPYGQVGYHWLLDPRRQLEEEVERLGEEGRAQSERHQDQIARLTNRIAELTATRIFPVQIEFASQYLAFDRSDARTKIERGLYVVIPDVFLLAQSRAVVVAEIAFTFPDGSKLSLDATEERVPELFEQRERGAVKLTQEQLPVRVNLDPQVGRSGFLLFHGQESFMKMLFGEGPYCKQLKGLEWSLDFKELNSETFVNIDSRTVRAKVRPFGTSAQ